jgi:phage terminase small subunit
MTKVLTRRKEDWPQLGQAMNALPNNKWRNFVEFYLLEKPGYGAQTNAARRAGFGKRHTKPLYMARIASRLMADPRIQAALAEEARKIVRGGAPEAANALLAMVRNPEHRDHARAVNMVLARTDPEVARHDISVTHKVIDEDEEARQELAALRALGTTREKLLELFGVNGLARIEALEAGDTARRASQAKVIDGLAVEVSHEQENFDGQ